MFQTEFEQLSNAAVHKHWKVKNRFWQYMMSAMFAGYFIFVATILSNIMSAVLTDVNWAFARLMGAFLFSIAIILIVFIGGELFTGNNMTMMLGFYTGKVKFSEACRVWFYSYIGNFIGIMLMCVLFYFSGAQRGILTDYYGTIIPGKLEVGLLELFLRGVLCNFLVCLAVFTGSKMKSESGKIIVMICVISSFVIAGFEHCIANMSTFALSAMFLGGLPWMEVLKSMVMVTLGNIVGGGFLFAFAIWFMAKDT